MRHRAVAPEVAVPGVFVPVDAALGHAAVEGRPEGVDPLVSARPRASTLSCPDTVTNVRRSSGSVQYTVWSKTLLLSTNTPCPPRAGQNSWGAAVKWRRSLAKCSPVHLGSTPLVKDLTHWFSRMGSYATLM
jgi:hypothetical protein